MITDKPRSQLFWEKVEVGFPDECWEWTAYRNPQGYGRFQGDDGKLKLAHRFSYKLDRGDYPNEELCVLHTCHNTSCVNPAHLYAGTKVDNSWDMIDAGNHGVQKLSDREVVEMRRRYENEDITQAELADEYGVHRAYVSLVINRSRREHAERRLKEVM